MRNPIVLILLTAAILHGQFAEVAVVLDMEWLNSNEQQQLQGLEETIQQFYLNAPWERDITDLDMVLDIQILFQSTIDLGSEDYYQAQVVFSNRQDQLLFDKNTRFPYSPGRAVQFANEYDPLGSVLTFYAYLLIAGELDTYEILAGSNYYTKANTLATLTLNQPQVGRDWGARIKLVKRLNTNQDMRRAKAYLFQAFDALAEEEPDLDLLKEALGSFYKSIDTMTRREGMDRHTTLFLTGHAEEIAEMLARAGMWRELADMAVLHTDGERFYKSYLKK